MILDALIEAVRIRTESVAFYPELSFRMAFVYLVATFDAFLTDLFEAVAVSRRKF